MSIHHTTIKAAAAKGVTLELLGDSDDDNPMVQASIGLGNGRGTTVVVDASDYETHTEAAKAAWAFAQDVVDYNNDPANTRVIAFDSDAMDFVAFNRGTTDDVARDPVLEDLIQTLQELADDEPEIDDDEPETSGSVVPDHYKKEYAARGNPAHCGDWLALQLEGLCRVSDGKKVVTDLDRLETIARANGVEAQRYGKLGVMTNGWQGRFRMTVRNMLTKLVAAKGFLFIPEGCGMDADTEVPAPAQWCAEHAPKAKATKAKAPKAKATKKVVAKDEGAGKPSAETLAKAEPIDGVAEATKAIRRVRAKKAQEQAAA